MINRRHALPIKRQAELVGISRSSVYYLPNPVSATDLALMRRIDELHLKHPFMGARMLRDQLNRAGLGVGREHVGALMKRMGVRPCTESQGPARNTPATRSIPNYCEG